MTMEVIMSVAFGLQTNFQVKGDKTITDVAKTWFHSRPDVFFIGMFVVHFLTFNNTHLITQIGNVAKPFPSCISLHDKLKFCPLFNSSEKII